MLAIILIHDESYGSIQTGQNKQSIDKGNMVWNKQCPSFFRHKLASDDLESVEGIGEQNQQQSEEGIRQKIQGPDGGAQGHRSGHNNDLANFWDWYDQARYPLKPAADAFRLGINFVVFGFTH